MTTAALPAPPVYRYTQRRAGAVIYVGPEPPTPDPGTSCTRMEWAEWGGTWSPPEIVF
ncbi:hypothetical protein ACPRNU_25315 [Chromobacterium vaccinii]|uniref:hypothetical protein n=1 Tax=Chromobacterium vaccinii TaxID=1108595 RepID=UPI003C78801E